MPVWIIPLKLLLYLVCGFKVPLDKHLKAAVTSTQYKKYWRIWVPLLKFDKRSMFELTSRQIMRLYMRPNIEAQIHKYFSNRGRHSNYSPIFEIQDLIYLGVNATLLTNLKAILKQLEAVIVSFKCPSLSSLLVYNFLQHAAWNSTTMVKILNIYTMLSCTYL